MGRYRLLIKRSASKEIEALPTKNVRQRVVREIRKLADEPGTPGCQKLSGNDRYRIRIGSYRVVCGIEDAELIVFVVKVAHRKDVYRIG